MGGGGHCLVSQIQSLVLGTLASTWPCSSNQMYNQCATSTREKNDHGLETKSSNRTLGFFLSTPIHVGVLLTILLIWDQYHSKKHGFPHQRYIFYICIELSKRKSTSGNGPWPRNSMRFYQNIFMKKSSGGPCLWLNKIRRQPSMGQRKKIMLMQYYVIYRINNRFFDFFWELLK